MNDDGINRVYFVRKKTGRKNILGYSEFISVQAEIEERRKFLEDMETLGQGGKYRSIIATEISQVCVHRLTVQHENWFLGIICTEPIGVKFDF